MEEIGHILREAREAKSLTIDDVAEKTRINERFITALEQGEYSKLPTPAHTRGFLRNYARFLHLDPDPLLERYQQTNPKDGAPAGTGNAMTYLNSKRPIPEIQYQSFFDPVNKELPDAFAGNSTSSGQSLAIITALIIAIILIIMRILTLTSNNNFTIQNSFNDLFTNNATSTITNTVTTDNDDLVPAPFTSNSNEAVSNTSRNQIVIPTVVATPTRPTLPATMNRVQLRLDILERTWVEVTIDGEIVLTDLVTREDGPYEWEALQEAKILTGNASGLFVTINDIELGRLGPRNQVAEETWSVTTN
ncbi:MAG TPA: RodZ domain-containing protein [Anaerolineae bacterium]|nr:RodZ domain-containing protein [Anaerolineae bacterium]